MSVVKIIGERLVTIVLGVAVGILTWFLIQHFITGELRVENERLKDGLEKHKTLLEEDSKKIGVLSRELAVFKNGEYISIEAKDKREKESKLKSIENLKSGIFELPPVKLFVQSRGTTDYIPPLALHPNPSSELDMPRIINALSRFCSNTNNIALFTGAADIYGANEPLKEDVGQFLGSGYEGCNVILNYNEYSQLSRFGKFLAHASGFVGTNVNEDMFQIRFNSMIRGAEKIVDALNKTSRQLQQNER